MVQKKVTLSLDSKTYEEFRKFCDHNAIMLSKKVEIWIKDFMKNETKKGGKK